MVVRCVMCTVEQREPAAAPELVQQAQHISSLREFRPVLRGERPPAARLVAEPAAQRVAWRDILEPEVNRQPFFGEATRPKAIDKNTHAVIRRRLVVGTLQTDCAACAAPSDAPRVPMPIGAIELPLCHGHFQLAHYRCCVPAATHQGIDNAVIGKRRCFGRIQLIIRSNLAED